MTPTTINPTLTDLNPIEMREWLEDMGSAGNIGFTVISTYQGRITSQILTESLHKLAELHPLLRTTFKVHDHIPQFFELKTLYIPLTEEPFTGKDQWIVAAKRDLQIRFSEDTKPLWRVSFLKGNQEGQILLTFHHAIADGVCGVEVMNHLYKIMSAKMLQREHGIQFDSTLPPLENLDRLVNKEPEKPVELTLETQEQDQGQQRHTTFVMDVIDEKLTGDVLKWSKDSGIKVHGGLTAAFIKAVQAIKKHSFEKIDAISFVNYRPYFEPPVSKEVARVLTTAILSKVNIGKFADMARELHTDLHTKLQKGAHITSLQELKDTLKRRPAPEKFLQASISTPNEHVITNIGKVDFDGTYDCKDLLMKEIYFVANIDPYYQHPHNIGLSVVTFQNRIYIAAFFVEESISEQDGKAILVELKRNLLNHCSSVGLCCTIHHRASEISEKA